MRRTCIDGIYDVGEGGRDREVRTSCLVYPALLLPVPLYPDSCTLVHPTPVPCKLAQRLRTHPSHMYM